MHIFFKGMLNTLVSFQRIAEARLVGGGRSCLCQAFGNEVCDTVQETREPEISRSKSVVGGAGLLKDVAPWCSVAVFVPVSAKFQAFSGHVCGLASVFH